VNANSFDYWTDFARLAVESEERFQINIRAFSKQIRRLLVTYQELSEVVDKVTMDPLVILLLTHERPQGLVKELIFWTKVSKTTSPQSLQRVVRASGWEASNQ
jgi:hypothetical protein